MASKKKHRFPGLPSAEALLDLLDRATGLAEELAETEERFERLAVKLDDTYIQVHEWIMGKNGSGKLPDKLHVITFKNAGMGIEDVLGYTRDPRVIAKYEKLASQNTGEDDDDAYYIKEVEELE